VTDAELVRMHNIAMHDYQNWSRLKGEEAARVALLCLEIASIIWFDIVFRADRRYVEAHGRYPEGL
jgi:hypothetical protein